ncbi:hypothetical protein [Geotalea uraniireducens]|uniref:Uncharacterized protein n=1 Tax=Geotalea uraniireducens (strain Rf4) TaxID=351605 RepID=A5GBD7_GEOUR|nr:hypothetical protein [Geotalea uraniireducens]ABQ25114.1 hypothetical protein Gura_0908 [Geotalea uraniireducens Rf4]
MEIFGGFMVMLSIIGFFLTVIWFILPFVIFSIKGKVDRTLILAEETERRLAAIEELLKGRKEETEGPDAPTDPLRNPIPPSDPPSAEE